MNELSQSCQPEVDHFKPLLSRPLVLGKGRLGSPGLEAVVMVCAFPALLSASILRPGSRSQSIRADGSDDVIIAVF